MEQLIRLLTTHTGGSYGNFAFKTAIISVFAIFCLLIKFCLTNRKQYQGIKPPVERTEENFDAGAKYHVPANVEYLR